MTTFGFLSAFALRISGTGSLVQVNQLMEIQIDALYKRGLMHLLYDIC